MLRKIVIIITLMAMILSITAMPAMAFTSTQEQTIRSAIQSQFDAFAQGLNYAGVDEDAIRQLLNHAVSGKGKPLTMAETDPFPRSMLNTCLFRTYIFEALLAAVEVAQYEHAKRVMVGTNSLAWHDFAMEYWLTRWYYNDTDSIDDDVILERIIPKTIYSGAVNSNDKAMMLVTGGVSCRIRLIQTSATDKEITYTVKIYVQDTFEFDNNYESEKEAGYDTSLSNLINMVGRLLDRGVLDTYDWKFHADFSLTVPNHCTHESASYRWEWDGKTLEVAAGEGLTHNPLTRLEKTKADGTVAGHYFRTEDTVALGHTLPWTLEFKTKGNDIFVMTNGDRYNYEGVPYILKSWGHVVGGEYFKGKTTDEATGKTATKSGRKQYGIDISQLGIKSTNWHTYRLQNRVNADGTNMVWLYVDGQEIGPMNRYFLNINAANQDQMVHEDWFNGKDFALNYIFNTTWLLSENIEVEYVQVWENGEGNAPQSYFASSVTVPTCTEQGHTTSTCRLCGAVTRDAYTPATGHNYQKTQTVAATCTEQGYCVYSCAACGDSYEADHENALGHSWDAGVVTKEATFRDKGEITFTCGGCRLTRTESYEKPLMDLEGTTMTLGDSLSVNFVLDIAPLEGDGAYAAITKTYADGRDAVTVNIPQRAWKQLSGNRYYIPFEGVAAKEMCDTISVQLYDAQGMKISNPYTDSIRDYAMRMLGKPEVTADAALRTLYVDMLNYGAAAQAHFEYGIQNMANNQLTEEQKAWASGTVETASRLLAGAGRAGTTLTLKSRITLDFIFSNDVLGTDVAGCYAVVSYANHYGKPVEVRIGVLEDYGDGRCYVSVPGLSAADYQAVVSCVVYNADGNIVALAADSIEGYAHRMADRLPAMVEAIVRFGHSAYQYFHK